MHEPIERLEARRARLAEELSACDAPFVKRERGEEAWLAAEHEHAEREIARAATALLRARGFRASGEKV